MGKGINVRHQKDEDADQRSQRDAVPENVAQDFTLMPIQLCRSTSDNNALRIDHLAHHAA